jgi:hypothetical protein
MPLQIRRGTDAERLAMTQPLAAGELLYVTNTQKIYVGTGTNLGGISVTGYTNAEAKDAAAASLAAGTHTGISFSYNTVTDALSATVDFTNIVGTVRADAFKGSVFADDGSTIGGTLLVDAVDGVLRGTHIGSLTGNVTGNVTGNLTGNSAGTHTGAVVGNTSGIHTGNVITSLIDSADSSAINFDAPVIFNTDVTVQNDLTIYSNAAADTINVKSLVLAGTANNGFKAGIRINTDGGEYDNYDLFTVSQAKNGVDGPQFQYLRTRGTLLAPAPVQNGDQLLSMTWYANDSTNTSRSCMYMGVSVIGAPISGQVPSQLNFLTFDSVGAPKTLLAMNNDLILQISSVPLVAGASSGQVNTGAVSTYQKIKIGSTYYAIPLYAIRP